MGIGSPLYDVESASRHHSNGGADDATDDGTGWTGDGSGGHTTCGTGKGRRLEGREALSRDSARRVDGDRTPLLLGGTAQGVLHEQHSSTPRASLFACWNFSAGLEDEAQGVRPEANRAWLLTRARLRYSFARLHRMRR